MKTKNLGTLSSIGLLMLAAIVISLSGCATNKAAWGSVKKGMNMNYDAKLDKELSYNTTTEFIQSMTVMEQEFDIIANNGQVLSFMPLASKDNDLEYVVTIGEMSSVIETPRGTMEADLEDVIGESFNFTLSKLGVELEFSGASDLTYSYGTGETKSISTDIQAFFPDLPGYPVKPGDSWESTDDIVEKTGDNNITIQFKNIHTFEKLEEFNGYECMKVNVAFTGSLGGKSFQDDMELITTGDLQGTSTWYYAYKEGILVSNVVDGTGETITKVYGPQEMEIPAKRIFKMKTELIGL